MSNATRPSKGQGKYDTEIKGDTITMLKAIQEHTLSYQENRYDAKIVIDLLRNLLNTKQRDDEDLVDFTRRFKAARDFHEAQVGTKMNIEKMAKIDEKWDETDDQVMKECFDRASARLMALLYLENSDQNKHGSVIKGLMDQLSLDQDQYPKTINHAMNVLSNHKFDDKYYENRKKNQDRKNKEDKKVKEDGDLPSELLKEINFAQLEGAFYCCDKKGHRSPKCPEKLKDKKDWAINKTKEAAFIQSAVSARADGQSVASAPPATSQEQNPFGWMACSIALGQIDESMREWVLINTASTVNVFCNKEM
jgi:hypothetical protein